MTYRSILLVAVLLACAATDAKATRRPDLTRVDREYINAIQNGDIPKARDLAQLGNIDPNNIAGAPLVASLFSNNGRWVPESMPLLSDAAFDYVFKELKQPFNTKLLPNEDRTVFSLMCLNFSRTKGFGQMNIAEVHNTISRIKYAFTQGADPRPLSGVSKHRRDEQPFPACVQGYLRYRHIPEARGVILSLLNDYLDKGADPDYDQPVRYAAQNLDVELFSVLTSHNVDLGRVFRVGGNIPAACSRGSGLTSVTSDVSQRDTLLGLIPSPKDTEIAAAREFLTAYIEAGGNIKEKQNHFGLTGVRCNHSTYTLFEKAVGLGQINYAKMVQEMEQLRVLDKALPFTASKPQMYTTDGSVPPAAAQPLSGSRLTTAEINVRELPALDGALMSTLGPNIAFEIEETSPDGQWSRINAAPIVRGWSNNAVIRKSSISNNAP